MEFFAFLLIGGFVVLVVGAIMGMIAKARTTELAARLADVEHELRQLRLSCPHLRGPAA